MLRYILGIATFLIAGTFVATAQNLDDLAEAYVGSDRCAKCHKDIHEDVARSGHPLKIQKLDGVAPAYPAGTSPGVPSPPVGMEWSDLSYVIGGYGWKARFMDREGYILTGPRDRQFNLANDNLALPSGWAGYDAQTAPRKPYTCGACHTTGWTGTGPNGPHQDGLPGIYGTWKEPGVTCEACHGPGAAHVASPTTRRLSTEQNCAKCHIRGDVAKIDASNALIQHHEQYEELLASPHRQIGCLACHDPHKGTKYGLGGYKGQEATCQACHKNQVTVTVATNAHRACISCHMPLAGKSAVAVTLAYEGGTVPKGDIRSHVFRVSTDPDWQMFTDDGKYVRVDEKGRAALTLEFACLSCHVDRDTIWAERNAKRVHKDR